MSSRQARPAWPEEHAASANSGGRTSVYPELYECEVHSLIMGVLRHLGALISLSLLLKCQLARSRLQPRPWQLLAVLPQWPS